VRALNKNVLKYQQEYVALEKNSRSKLGKNRARFRPQAKFAFFNISSNDFYAKFAKKRKPGPIFAQRLPQN